MMPHPLPIFKGTIARVAIQCVCPDTSAVGDFLFTGESPQIKGSRVTEVFVDLEPLFRSIKPEWEQVGYAYVYKGKL